MNYKMIKYTLGWILTALSAFMLIPLLTAAICREIEFFGFLGVALICLALGLILVLHKPSDTTLYAREGFIIAALSWIVISLFGALPFIFTGVLSNPIDAFFETVSGFTTTGATIFTSVESLPRSILIWRSFSHWIGGMGVLVFLMLFLPLAGGQNMHIMKAESPGPDVSKVTPKVKQTALILYGLYIGLTLICFISYWISGFTFFEALCNAFSTAGTGGFGIRDDSYLTMTAAQQWLAIIFMTLFSINFSSYYLLLRGKIKDAFNYELRIYLILLLASISAIFVNVYLHLDEFSEFSSPGEVIRAAAFYVTSISSTTGFCTYDFCLWPTLSQCILVLLLFIGACAGSTGGGFKLSRVIILLKGVKNEINKLIHPRQVKKISIDKRVVSNDVVRSVNAFLAAYVMIFILSTLLVSIDGKDLLTSATAVLASLSNVGPGLGEVGPTSNFAGLSNLSKLVLIFDMLAGRLELFPMLVLLSPSTYKKRGF